MKLAIPLGFAVVVCAACAHHGAARPAAPVLVSAGTCANAADLREERRLILDDMHLTARERARLDSTTVRSSQPALPRTPSAGAHVAVSLGDAQGMKNSGQVASGNPVDGYSSMRQTAPANPRDFLMMRLRGIDEKLSRLPSTEDCSAAHLAD